MKDGKVCCLIPAHNEGETIARVIRIARPLVHGIIVVDDGSEDRTALVSKDEGAVVLSHARNLGKGMALRTGFAYALRHGFDAVITLDGDGQHDPEEIGKFLSAYEGDRGDIIIGSRLWNPKAVPKYRLIPNRIGIFCISRAAGCRIEDTQSGFRLYRKEVLEQIQLTGTGFETESEVLMKAGRRGFRIHCIPVAAIYHENYRTHFRPVRDFYRISMQFLKIIFPGGER